MSHPFLKKLFALFVILMLVLAACERPLQQPSTPTDVAPTSETTGEQAGEEVAAPAAGEEAAGEAAPVEGEVAPAEGEAAPAEGEAAGESPRPGDEAAPAEGEAAPAEGEAAPAEGEAAPAEGEAVAAPTARPETHTVAQGESLYQIGLKYGLSWVVLAQYNNLPNANRIEAGQVLRIPPLNEPAAPTLEETTYTVQAGDNLFRIGLAYGISWVQIAEANGIVNPNQIVVGQVLKIPANAPGIAPEFVHKVEPGETLFLISLRYGVVWTTIAEKNNITAPYVIYPGQELVIPGGN